jgi:hypothetical protein
MDAVAQVGESASLPRAMMAGRTPDDELRSAAFTSQIIVLALATGVIVFGVIAFFLSFQLDESDAGILVYAMAALAAAAVLARMLAPALIAARARKAIAAGMWRPAGQAQAIAETLRGRLAEVYLTKTIVGSALLEGAAFANLVAYLLTGRTFSAAISALLLVGILLGFPTGDRVAAWVDGQQRLIEEEEGLAKTP